MSFSDSELYVLHEIVTRLDRIAQNTILGPAGLTYPEFLVLMTLREDGPRNQQTVASDLNFSKSLLSQRVASLLNKDLVRQDPHPESRRDTLLVLTLKGQSLIESVYEKMQTNSSDVFSALAGQQPEFRHSLELIRRVLQEKEYKQVPDV